MNRPVVSRLTVFAGAALASSACSGDEAPAFAVPRLDTPYALFGTASAGRPLDPRVVRVVEVDRASGLRPDFIGGGDIDMVWAGLDPLDLPAGVSPESLVFVAPRGGGTRELPRLVTPHVLRRPSPPAEPEALVLTEVEGLPPSVLMDRTERLETMLSGVAITEPCRAPTVPWTTNTPRIPSEAVVSARAMTNGSTVLGLATTSTAVLGVVEAGSLEVVLIGVGAGPEVVPQGGLGSIDTLGGPEVTHRSGALVPSELSLSVQAGFGSAATIWLWSAGTWREDTPILPDVLPRRIRGLQHLDMDGVASFCAFGTGTGQDSSRPACLWCRPDTGGEWTLAGRFQSRFGLVEVVDTDGTIIAADSGGVLRERSNAEWFVIFETPINRGCEPPRCVFFNEVVRRPVVGGGSDVWLAGESAQVVSFAFRPAATVSATEPGGLDDALFGDERATASTPVTYDAVTVSPDGALWLASDRGFLLRRAPTGEVERICLPDVFQQIDVGAMVAHPDGRLIVAGSPVTIAQSSWQ